MYQLRNLSKTFSGPSGKLHVLRNLTMDLPEHQWIAFVGPSGCGKTTLLQLLGGLDRPTSGQLLLDQQDLATLSPAKLTELRQKRIGIVFQSFQLFPELDALENTMLPALSWHTNRSRLQEQATELLKEFGLEARLHHRPMELSGGEQQRVAIARALIHQPDILLADEPTGNLDPASAQQVAEIFTKLRQQKKISIFMVTHDPRIAAQADCRIAFDSLQGNP